MIITCGECDSSFVLDDSFVKPSGSKVRCSSCKNIFVVYPTAPKPEPAPAPPPEPPVPKPEAQKPSAAPATPETKTDLQDDPDLTKAVEEIREEELEFTAEELGLDAIEEPAPAMAVPKPPAAEKTVAPPVEEPLPASMEEPEPPVEESDEDILDFADFEMDIEEDDVLSESVSEEGDDLDFSDLELEQEAGPVEEAAGELQDEDELGFDFESDITDSADTVVMDEESLDFSDLELALDDEDAGPPIEADEPETMDDFSLDLEEDVDLKIEPEVEEEFSLDLDEDLSGQPEPEMVEEELDFSDLDLELDGSEDGPASEPATIEDLDLDLGLDEDGFDEEPGTVMMDEDELDFSEFELDLEGEGASEEETPEPAEIDELDLGLELEEETVTPVADEESAEEELDFSDLAGFLDSEQPPAEEPPAGDEDLDLELELDSDLDLDLDEEPLAAATGAVEEADEELDFSDLENILDNVDESDLAEDEGPAEDINLELDMEMDGSASDSEADLSLASDEEDLDFSDVEAMLGSEEDVEKEEELDLDLGLSLEEEVKDFEDNADIDLSLDDGEQGDIELELDLDGEEAPEEEVVDEIDIEEVDEAPAVVESAKSIKEKKKKEKKRKPKRKAGGAGKLLFKLFLLVFFLLILAFAAYMSRAQIEEMTGFKDIPEIPLLENVRDSIGGMALPFISEWVKPVDKDPEGKLKLKTLRISGKIVPNDVLGDILVITGKVQNLYEGTRNSIRFVGKLKDPTGKVVQQKKFYAGNVIPEEQLANVDADTIKKVLNNRLGDNGINQKVRPSQIIPLMVIFTNLPENLSEFSVEPAGSLQGAAIK